MIVGSTISPAAAVGTPVPPPPAPLALSPRLRLARLARDSALGVPGVAGLDAGEDGRFAVVSGEDRINGVLCVATAGGGYDIELRLVCGLVPLIALGERVRAEVRERATAAGLPLATISVHIAGVTAPGEL